MTEPSPKGEAAAARRWLSPPLNAAGEARARRAGTHCERTITTFLSGNCSLESVLPTDELPAYRWIGRKLRAHLRVNHSGGEYVRTDPHAGAAAHASAAKSWNATLKRAIADVWHWLSIKHLIGIAPERPSAGITMPTRLSAMLGRWSPAAQRTRRMTEAPSTVVGGFKARLCPTGEQADRLKLGRNLWNSP